MKSRWSNHKEPAHSCPPIVWDSVDCISYLFRQSSVQSKRRVFRWITQLELKRTEKFEAELTKQFPAILVSSQKDKNALLALKNSTPSTSKLNVFPIGVDLDYFCPDQQAKREAATLVVGGKMSYHANVSMALYLVNEIMPLVWAKRPEARVAIVGKDPPANIVKLADDPRVQVTGMVPDIRPYLQRAETAVMVVSTDLPPGEQIYCFDRGFAPAAGRAGSTG